MKYELIYIRTDKNGTKYYADYNCPRCGGDGYIYYYGHVEGGVCFKCGGTGRREKAKIVKVYTEEYAEKLEERRRARAIAKTPERNARFLENMGFNADGMTWVVLGDTYAIKDELKERGAKYNRTLGWHFAEDVEDYFTLEVSADEVFSVSEYDGHYMDYSDYGMVREVMDKIEEANIEMNRQNDTTEYVGEVGDRIEMAVTLTRISTFETNYTYCGELNFIYNFTDADGNVLIWKTTKCIDKEVNDKITLKGTVKAHDEYKGTKQTVLTRCKVA